MNQPFKREGDITLILPVIQVFSRKEGWKVLVTWGESEKQLFFSNEFIDYQTVQIGEMLSTALRECAAEGKVVDVHHEKRN